MEKRQLRIPKAGVDVLDRFAKESRVQYPPEFHSELVITSESDLDSVLDGIRELMRTGYPLVEVRIVVPNNGSAQSILGHRAKACGVDLTSARRWVAELNSRAALLRKSWWRRMLHA